MKTRMAALVVMILSLLQAGCFYAVRYDGPYRGKVVDATTKEPVEGVVVLGTWYTETPTLAGATHQYNDAQEAVTDKNGDFLIEGKGLRVMSRLLPVYIMLFKSGYEYIGPVWWKSLKQSDHYIKQIIWDGDKPTFPLKKLTMGERRRMLLPSPPHGAKKDRIKLMVNEINRELSDLGEDPIKMGQ